MTRYAFTGPSGLTSAQQLYAQKIMTQECKDATEWTTGAAHGLDTLAHLSGWRVAPIATHRVVIPAAPHNENILEMAKVDEVIRMPRLASSNDERNVRATAYRSRNKRMLDFADVLIAFVRFEEFYRSGEFMTINMAEKRNIPVRKFVLP